MNNYKGMCMALLIVAYGTAAVAVASGADLAVYRWTHRPLLIFAPSTADTRYDVLNESISRLSLKIDDRDMIIFRIFDSGPSWAADKPLSTSGAASLRRQFGVGPGRFTVVLVGKDGGVKMSRQDDVDLQAIFNLIDGMPMRRQEMREKNAP